MRGGVCIYYKDHLPIIKRNDLCQLHECLVTELRIGKKKCFFTCLYRSPSQTSNEFEDFCTDLNLFLSNINDHNLACSVITGDFIDRSLFQIFRRFFLRKVWLLNVVPYVSESRKLPVPIRTFGLRGLWHHYDVIRTSKICFNALNSNQSDENGCNRYVFLRFF